MDTVLDQNRGSRCSVDDVYPHPIHLISCSPTVRLDEVIVAITSEGYLQVSVVVDRLQNFGKPIGAVPDLGPRLAIREKLLQ